MSANIGQLSLLVASEGRPSVFASEFVALVVIGQPPSRYIPVSELAVLVVTEQGKIVSQVSETLALVVYAVGGTERLNSRAWGFEFDQHQFYVLHLGQQGTFVYDILSGEWAQWQTAGSNTWNMENGVVWNGEVYAGDNANATLWKLDPESYLDDDFRTITRVVTGGIPAEGRDGLNSGMLVLSSTRQGLVDDESVAYVKLSISDDGGFVYRDRNQIVIDPDKETQDFSWRSLGTIKRPGRVFKITDVGGFVTINGANQDIEGEDDDEES